MPLRAVTGFEFGTTAGAGIGNAGNKIFDVVNGTVAFNTGAAARTGTYGYHHDSNNATQGVKWNTDTLGTGQTRLLTAFWFRFPTAVPDHDTPFWAMHCVGPDMAGWFVSARDGRTTKLAISFDDITYFYNDSVNIVADTWYFLEAHWDVSISTTPITWRVNTIDSTTATSGSAADTIAEVELGYINNLRTFICDYDDWAVWTDTSAIAFPGKQKVVQLTPDTGSTLTVNGVTTNWNIFSGATPTESAWNATTALTNIDEVPINLGASQDGFQQIVNATTAYVEVPLTSYTIATGESVTGARMLIPGWAATTTAATIGFRSWNGTTETTLFAAADPNFDNSSTPAWVCKMLTTADVDTQGELDALAIRVGFSGDTSPHIGVHAVYVEVAITEAVASSIPWTPPRMVQTSDPGETWWIQRDRRDANTVGTAANPLPAPLDSAWQAGSRYWHLYADAADAAPRTWQSLQRSYTSDPNLLAPPVVDVPRAALRVVPVATLPGIQWQQRPYASDPNLLATSLLEISPLAQRVAPVATPAEVQWLQRSYVSDPNLLATSLLEISPLAQRVAPVATPAEAQWLQRPYLSDPALLLTALLEVLPALPRVALVRDSGEIQWQQRIGSDPNLLASAVLENELLGGADTAKRYGAASTHAARWWMPQQPNRWATAPGLLDSAELEGPLLAGDTRRQYAAAAYTDRREVPQQRPYISDPSFYPTVASIDPLVVAYGAGGTYWLLYNQAAVTVDRRQVPQQHQYISDPGLLLTALLENELLGGADDIRRRYTTAAYADRRTTVAIRLSTDPNLLTASDADPLMLAAGVGADTWRRTNIPAYADRRQVPQQPTRQTWYFDAGADVPPLTLSWGAGGNLWHLYQWRRPARSWWPERLLFLPLGDPCITVRPNTGITPRPNTGITPRPNTGITTEPC